MTVQEKASILRSWPYIAISSKATFTFPDLQVATSENLTPSSQHPFSRTPSPTKADPQVALQDMMPGAPAENVVQTK